MTDELEKKKWYGYAVFTRDKYGRERPVWQAFSGMNLIYGTRGEALTAELSISRIAKVEIKEL